MYLEKGFTQVRLHSLPCWNIFCMFKNYIRNKDNVMFSLRYKKKKKTNHTSMKPLRKAISYSSVISFSSFLYLNENT